MERNEIRMMQAGRELDERIADEVMGLFVLKKPWESPPKGFVFTSEAWREYLRRHPNESPSVLINLRLGSYSTKMKDASQVIERMLSLGYEYEAKQEEEKHQWRFFREGEEKGEFAESESAPEAICKAALIAIQSMNWENTAAG